MELTIFAKRRRTHDGKAFYAFLTTLTKKDGDVETMSVKFKNSTDEPKPENCPMNILVNREDANISHTTYTREDTGEPARSSTLWVSRWEPGSEYVDTSLDEYEI